MQHIAHITLPVTDYDDAIEFYNTKLGFPVLEDKKMTDTKRWMLIAPPGSSGTSILLTMATTEQQHNLVGEQSAEKVFMCLFTDDISKDYDQLKKNGIVIIEEPEVKLHGKVLIFSDLYGNQHDLIKPNLE